MRSHVASRRCHTNVETRFSVVMIQSLVSLFEASMMVLDCITHRHNCSTVGGCLLALYLDLDGRPRDDVLVSATHDRAILPPRGGARGVQTHSVRITPHRMVRDYAHAAEHMHTHKDTSKHLPPPSLYLMTCMDHTLHSGPQRRRKHTCFAPAASPALRRARAHWPSAATRSANGAPASKYCSTRTGLA
jgi:hypothetical protein